MGASARADRAGGPVGPEPLAAMPSIPQESDAEVTEEMLVAAFRAHEATIGQDNFAAYFTAIYTAMTDKRG